MKKLNPNGIGIASAVLAGITMLILGIAAMMGYFVDAFQVMKAFHIGFDATIVGTLIGVVEAAVISYIGGYLFAEIYNRVATS